MTVTFRPAVRENVSLLIGLAGPSGSGKTYSAMQLATGLANGKRFAVIDTEAGRALHYADQFQFDHADLRAPFRPASYADAIQAADQAGYPVVLVDSMSHEWDGDGGVLDWQEAEFERLGARDSVKMLSWQAPKRDHRKMLTRLLQVRAHVILCFRAADKVEMAKVDGRTVVRPKQTLTGLDGWVPICEPRLPYELTLSALLLPDRPGVARPIKLQEQHRALLSADRPISKEAGRLLAEWAAGGVAATAPAPAPRAVASKPGVITADQRQQLVDLVAGLDIDADTVKHIIATVAGAASSKSIPTDRFGAVCDAIVIAARERA